MAVLLALTSALAYGVSDYVGGRTSRRHAPIAVTLVAELALLAVFGLAVPLLESGGPTPAAIGWGTLAGAAGSLGVLGLYAALSQGAMTVVAPVTGVVAAVVPVLAGVVLGERPGAPAVVGIVVAILAVGLIGGAVGVVHQRAEPVTVLLAVAVGGAFGLLFVAYSRTGDDSGLWPLLTARVGGTPLLAGAYLVARRRRAVPPIARSVVPPSLVIGALVGVGNALYLASTREGLLSIVAVVVSLYPASTVALASVLDHERASRSQHVGMLLAGAAVVAVTVGS